MKKSELIAIQLQLGLFSTAILPIAFSLSVKLYHLLSIKSLILDLISFPFSLFANYKIPFPYIYPPIFKVATNFFIISI